MLVYVSSFRCCSIWPGICFHRWAPVISPHDQLIGLAVVIFAVQKLAQFGQDSLLAGPACL